jgi:outer membrane autotransporter protein
MKQSFYSGKILAAAILGALLTTGPVWAATQTATDTVTTSNTAGTRYTSIAVTQDSSAEKDTIAAIATEEEAAMHVYLAPGATITANSAADGTSVGKYAYGITADNDSLTVNGALNVTAAATTAATQTGTGRSIYATGIDNYGSDLTLGEAGSTNTITATASGTYKGLNTGTSVATVYGIFNEDGSITINGDTTLNVSAQGLMPAENAKLSRARAKAIGVYTTTSGPILKTPSKSSNNSLTFDALAGTISAQGGTVNTGSSNAYAKSTGIDNSGSNVTAHSVDLTVTAKGGTAVGDAKDVGVWATAKGLNQSNYNYDYEADSNSKLTVTGATALHVTAIGGNYTGTATAEDSSAVATGIGTLLTQHEEPILYSGTYKLGDVTAVVNAIGGTDNAGSEDPENQTTGGDVSAAAAGVATGIGSLTAKNLDLTATAQGGTAAGKYASINTAAYGLFQINIDPHGPNDASNIMVTGDTKLNVSATGGNTTGSGSTDNANTNAVGLATILYTVPYPILGDMELGAVSGSISATGGTVNATNAITQAIGGMNGGSLNTITEAQDSYAGGTMTMDSLDLNVTASGAKLTGTTNSGITTAAGMLQSSVSTDGNSTLTITGATNLNVTATGAEPTDTGILTSAITNASGLTITESNFSDTAYTVADLGPVTATVTANGGTVNDALSTLQTNATGFTIANQVKVKSLDLTVTVNGDTVKGTTEGNANEGNLETHAYGIKSSFNNSEAQLTVPGAVNFSVSATSGTATDGAEVKNNRVTADGITLGSDWESAPVYATLGSVNGSTTVNGGAATTGAEYIAAGITSQNDSHLTTGDVNLTVAANGSMDTPASTYLSSAGITAFANSSAQINGNAIIKTAVTPAAGANGYGTFAASALEAIMASTINVGTDGDGNPLNKTVQIEGSVVALMDSIINLTLDNNASYLQGNVISSVPSSASGISMPPGTVNLVVANGATWRPVYDNRYGDFSETKEMTGSNSDGTTYTYTATSTYAPNYTVKDNSIDTLTLKDGGIVDLTWDNPTRSSEFRTLSIGNLTGNDGVFKLNADLRNNKADSISIGPDSTSTQAYIDVAYDPALAIRTLTAGQTITGKANVVSASPTSMTFTGKLDSYNLYTYTPTLVNNGDGTWDLTALTIDSAKTSGHVTSGAQDRIALNSLWYDEANNLAKRMGDLRGSEPAEAGIWARYNHSKLEQANTKLMANLFQVGYDKDSATQTGTIYRGLAVSHATGNADYDLGSGDVKETTLSLYQTGVKDDGRYYDIIAKVGKYQDDYDLTKTANVSHADYDTWAYSISGEYGKRYELGRGLYVEPQAEFILGRLNGTDYTTSTGMKVDLDAQNRAIARIGTAFGKTFTSGSLYGRLSYYHDFGSGISLTATDDGHSLTYGRDLAKNWGELTLGGTMTAGKDTQIYGELTKYIGQLTSNIQFNIGARWKI